MAPSDDFPDTHPPMSARSASTASELVNFGSLGRSTPLYTAERDDDIVPGGNQSLLVRSQFVTLGWDSNGNSVRLADDDPIHIFNLKSIQVENQLTRGNASRRGFGLPSPQPGAQPLSEAESAVSGIDRSLMEDSNQPPPPEFYRPHRLPSRAQRRTCSRKSARILS